MESVLFRVLSSRAQAVAEAVSSWPQEGGASPEVRVDIEDAIDECLRLPAGLRDCWNTTLDRFATGKLSPSNQLRETLVQLFDAAIVTVSSLSHTVGNGSLLVSPERHRDVQSCLAKIQSMKQEAFAHWEPFTLEEFRRAGEEIARGECSAIEDILRELQGHHR